MEENKIVICMVCGRCTEVDPKKVLPLENLCKDCRAWFSDTLQKALWRWQTIKTGRFVAR